MSASVEEWPETPVSSTAVRAEAGGRAEAVVVDAAAESGDARGGHDELAGFPSLPDPVLAVAWRPGTSEQGGLVLAEHVRPTVAELPHMRLAAAELPHARLAAAPPPPPNTPSPTGSRATRGGGHRGGAQQRRDLFFRRSPSLPISLPCFRLRARIACPGRQVGSARGVAHAETTLYWGYPGAARNAQYALPSPGAGGKT
jgi:hypothetical protein